MAEIPAKLGEWCPGMSPRPFLSPSIHLHVNKPKGDYCQVAEIPAKLGEWCPEMSPRPFLSPSIHFQVNFLDKPTGDYCQVAEIPAKFRVNRS